MNGHSIINTPNGDVCLLCAATGFTAACSGLPPQYGLNLGTTAGGASVSWTLPPSSPAWKASLPTEAVLDSLFPSDDVSSDGPVACAKCSVELCEFFDAWYGKDESLAVYCAKCRKAMGVR
jgi:hypothetical protein